MAELIVALDHADAPQAVDLLDLLPGGAAVKIGSVLMSAAGPGFVRATVQAGHPVFLDLKWHDIPNTVAGAVRAARGLGVEMVTVHALGGREMIASAVEAAAGEIRIVAVTVLTSHDQAALSTILGREADPAAEVERLARMALDAGADGLVCSPLEVARLAVVASGRRLVVPGIRRAEDAIGDQSRVAGPSEAVRAGATHLVVGRPITGATDPARAWQAFHDEASGR